MSEALVERLRNADTNSQQRAWGSRIFGEAADRIEALEREVKELRAEAKEHKRLKNELVLKAYPAMDAIDEIAERFRSAVHFVRNNAMNMDRDYPEICHAEEVFSRARAALSGSSSGWRTMEDAPKDRTRIILAWSKPENLPPHIELGYWSDGKASWVNTYGNSFSGEPNLWFLPPLPAAPQQGGE